MLCCVPFLRRTTIGWRRSVRREASSPLRSIRICFDLPLMTIGESANVSPSATSIGVRTSCCSALSFKLSRLSLKATSTRLSTICVCTLSIVTAPEAIDCAMAVLLETAATKPDRRMRVNEFVLITLICYNGVIVFTISIILLAIFSKTYKPSSVQPWWVPRSCGGPSSDSGRIDRRAYKGCRRSLCQAKPPGSSGATATIGNRR